MALTLLRFAAIVGVGGSLVAVAVPAFVRNLSSSKLTEPLQALERISHGALAHAASHPPELAFPPSVERTPSHIPRGERVVDAAGTWSHLTWRSLGFSMTEAHAFAYQFDSQVDAAAGRMQFAATAMGDLDGDGNTSTFQVQGSATGQGATVFSGILIDREVE